MNIVEPILYQCKLNPFATAIATPGSGLNSIKYGHLERLIHNVARAALRTGFTPGQTVALLIEDAVLHAALALGLMRIGIVTMSLAEGRVPEHLTVDVVITDSPQLFAGQSQSVIAANNSWLQGEGTPLDYARVYRGNENDICRIILTSGSTGRPKGVAFSHKALADRVAHYTYAKGPLLARTSRLFCDLGIPSSPGFRYLIFMLSRGGTIYYSGRDPTAILHYLHPFKVQGLALSPHNLEIIVHAFEEDPDLDCNLEFMICQGARLSRELTERARRRICQNLYVSYGSTETTTVACGPAHAIGHIPGAVGYVVPGVTVDILDGDGRPQPPGSEGRVAIRSPHQASGYVGDPETSAQIFRGGAFHPGDLGLVTADGLLVITGRAKTTLTLGGDSVAPEVVEEALCTFPGVAEAAAFTLDSLLGVPELFALIVARGSIDEEALRAHCVRHLRPVFIPQRFIAVDAIPRGGQNKIDRQRVAEIGRAKVQVTQ
ncbi:MAG TPA: fatty acid--CoA ligase family protein [Xanthobacteraceae bacterium]|nr:fatty acid--CoA ligase family protein [Xanthobacteraceae bacterium]